MIDFKLLWNWIAWLGWNLSRKLKAVVSCLLLIIFQEWVPCLFRELCWKTLDSCLFEKPLGICICQFHVCKNYLTYARFQEAPLQSDNSLQPSASATNRDQRNGMGNDWGMAGECLGLGQARMA